jgi:hypothetical protein
MRNNKDACDRKTAALKHTAVFLFFFFFSKMQPYKPVTETELVLNCSEFYFR